MISRKEFIAGTFKKRVFTRRSEHPIAKLLKAKRVHGLKVREIARRLKMNDKTIRSMLICLIKDGLVLHKSPYFMWKK